MDAHHSALRSRTVKGPPFHLNSLILDAMCDAGSAVHPGIAVPPNTLNLPVKIDMDTNPCHVGRAIADDPFGRHDRRI